MMNNQNSQLLLDQLMSLSHMMIDQSHSQWSLNNRCGGYVFNNQIANPSGYDRSSLITRNNQNWKVKNANDRRNNNKWMEVPVSINNYSYNSRTLKELQQHNRLKGRRKFSKKKFNHGGKSAPFAPRNTTSFLIRTKKSGGIASLVSQSPDTPAVLTTPIFSPLSEVLIDTVTEEWGVNGYGSMKGLIRLRSPENDEDEEHLKVGRKLDHDLSRFKMIYPNYRNSCILENRVDDQDTYIDQLEEQNLMLKERLFLMESEFDNLRSRLQSLETRRQKTHVFMEEVVENDSEIEDSNALSEEKNVDDKESVNGERSCRLADN